MGNLYLLCHMALVATLLPSFGWSQVSNRDAFLSELRKIQQSEQKNLSLVDEGLQKILKTSTQMSSHKLKDPAIVREFTEMKKQIEDLSDEREELLARQDFLNQLCTLTETKTTAGTDMRGFLWTQLLEMAGTSLGIQTNSLPQSHISVFLVYLSIAVRELPESVDSLARFVESYIKYSSLLDPKDPYGFAEKYEYVGRRTPSPSPSPQKTPVPEKVEPDDYEGAEAKDPVSKPAN